MSKEVSMDIKKKVIWRHLLFGGTGSFNYEKMQGLSYCYSMYPFLKELYKDNPDDLKESMLTHLQFFNTNTIMTPFIMGINMAVEETEKTESLPTVATLKTSLMGPLAGLGDTLLISTPIAVFGGIAASMAIKGNVAGSILWLAVMFAIKFLVFPFFKFGYNSGSRMLQTLEKQMQSVTSAISIVGLMVVGALIATVINVNVVATYTSGDMIIKGQEILDSIMPSMLPAALTIFVYWMLGKKNMTTVKLIIIIIIMSIVFSALGIFG